MNALLTTAALLAAFGMPALWLLAFRRVGLWIECLDLNGQLNISDR